MHDLRLAILRFFLRLGVHRRVRGGWRFCAMLAAPFASLRWQTGSEAPIFLDLRGLDDHGVSIFLGGNQRHEAGEQKLLRRLVREGDTVVDIGANLGVFTLLFAEAAGRGGRVISVEPNPALQANLAKTVANLPQVQRHSCALGEAPGTAAFFVPHDDHMLASLANWSGQKTQTVDVNVETLDNLLQGCSRVDLVKIDVEGAEEMVLRGAERLLAAPNPPIVFFEQVPRAAEAFGYDACAAQRRIARTGRFTLYRVLADGRLERLDKEFPGLANLIAIPAHRESRIGPGTLSR